MFCKNRREKISPAAKLIVRLSKMHMFICVAKLYNFFPLKNGREKTTPVKIIARVN